MKIGSGRLRLSKLPDAPPTPTSKSSSSPHLAYGDGSISSSKSTSSENLAGLNKITTSSSKSSGALLTPLLISNKHKWSEGKTAVPSNEIYQLLAEQKLSEDDIWGGHPSLFPILHQYQELFSATNNNSNINNNNSKVQQQQGHVLSIVLPDHSDFVGVKKRTYKIGRKITVAQTVNLICKKQNVKDPRRFWLTTLVGFVLNDDLLLGIYGFGTFFDSWELKLILKDQYLSRVQTDPILDYHGDYIIDFELPPLKQFNGLKKKRIKVDSLMTVSNIIESIWKKYKIEESFEKFSIVTNEEFPLVLNKFATLSHYGLGYKFNQWELNIIYSEFIPPYALRNDFVPSYGSFQVGKIDPVQNKAVIVDMENKLHESVNLNDEMVINIKQMAQDIKDKNQEVKEKEQHHLIVMSQIEEKLGNLKANMLLEKENFQNQIQELHGEKTLLNENLVLLKVEIEDLNEKRFQEKQIYTENDLKLNFNINSLNESLKNLNEKYDESITSQKDIQDRYDLLQQQKDDQESKYIDQISKLKSQYHDLMEKQKQQEKEQEEIYNSSINLVVNNDTSNNKNNNNNDIILNSIEEQEQLLLKYRKLQNDLSDRDVLIKTVYPKKIQLLESNVKKLDGKIYDLEQENQQFTQTMAKQNLEIQELKRQIELMKSSNKELTSANETLTTLFKDEEKKNRKLMYDQATLSNELEHERLQREQLNKTIVDLEATKMAVEISAKQRESFLLLEIEELKKPKPPPLPTYSVKDLSRSPDTGSELELCSEIVEAKNLLKKPPPPVEVTKEHAIHTVADILFVSMQKRFKSIQDDDEIENLDDDDFGEFD